MDCPRLTTFSIDIRYISPARLTHVILIQIELLDRHCWPGAASHPGDGARSQERGAGARGPQTASSHRLDNEVRSLLRPCSGPHTLRRSVSGSMQGQDVISA